MAGGTVARSSESPVSQPRRPDGARPRHALSCPPLHTFNVYFRSITWQNYHFTDGSLVSIHRSSWIGHRKYSISLAKYVRRYPNMLPKYQILKHFQTCQLNTYYLTTATKHKTLLANQNPITTVWIVCAAFHTTNYDLKYFISLWVSNNKAGGSWEPAVTALRDNVTRYCTSHLVVWHSTQDAGRHTPGAAQSWRGNAVPATTGTWPEHVPLY